MKQYIIVILKKIGVICWLLLKSILRLLSKGANYIYLHRREIMQHKVTLPVLIVLSVLWTGFSSIRYASVRDTTAHTAFFEDTASSAPKYYHSFTQATHINDADKTEPAEPFRDTRLVAHIMDWVGTPHQDNTQSKNGTDCSGFVQAVFMDAHGIELSRSSRAMYNQDVHKIRKKDLQEGDLVFFNTFGNDISHVGIYLKDGKFAHTSSSKGVTVSSLYERYYQKNYRGAGRVIQLNSSY